MSTPTFNDHLKHLIKKHYVKRRIIAKQNVEYFLNLDNLRIVAAREKTLDHMTIQKNTAGKLSSLTIGASAKFLAYLSTYLYMDQIRILIDGILKRPKDPFDHVIAFNLDRIYLERLYGDMLIACNKDRGACERALETLEKAMDLVDKEAEKLLGIDTKK